MHDRTRLLRRPRPQSRAPAGWSACAPAWLPITLLLALAGCGSGQTASPTPSERASPPPTPARTPTQVAQVPAPTPHLADLRVVHVVQARSSETGQHVFAMLLSGDVGTSAVLRSLEISAWTEPIDGSSCGAPPIPSVLRPQHADAVQPALADQTRTLVVRSQGPRPGAGSQPSTRFRYGPVPSLNGGFGGWVSFHFPAASEDGFCAFDVRGVVVVVAGETTVAELPIVRIDTRDP